ncbi:hypothetical protein [Mesorhizobium tamadayense]|uniref:hypothetical protein n=1 Tax=Mesorhizobium tamadayense TaxID=425306 RepID=UPI00142D3AF6|nr:hypothetical protein [Mesorhizobium tamadayense]
MAGVSTWRRQWVLVADADELRPRRDPPGDFAIASKIEQSGNREIDAVQIVHAGIDQAGEVGKTAQMRHAGDARFDRRQPVAQRRAHRHAVDTDAVGENVVACARNLTIGYLKQ